MSVIAIVAIFHAVTFALLYLSLCLSSDDRSSSNGQY